MTAIYPGSFDPVTNGHLDIIKRSAKMTNKLIVAVLNNSAKKPMFDVAERVEMLRLVCKDIPNIEVAAFSGLLVDFAQKMGAQAIIKGIRGNSDFEYEYKMALLNKDLNHGIETIFMLSDIKYSHISSSAVKEIAILGGNIGFMVCDDVRNKILQKLSHI
ncbi:MAG: pantetheine-phosphate adenylyltransferase [Defluviitaleaceae bacterium]|nr:pantetheine-phosphate adenylyltransferase [Defluviitaleaceae bacterium]